MPHRLDTDQARRQFAAYVAAIFSLPSQQDIMRELRELNPPLPYRVRVKVLYSRDQAVQIFDSLTEGGLFSRLNEEGPGFSFQAVRGEDLDSTVLFAVLATDQPHVTAVVSVAGREEWHVLLRAIKREYPNLVPIYLSQRELLLSVGELRKRVSTTYDLRVREISARETLQSPEGQRVRSVREWTYEDWEKAVSHMSDRRQIVLSVGFAFHRRLGDKIDVIPAALCKVTKRGEVDLTGRYDLIWSTVIAHIAAAGEQKLAFYAKRGLREREYKPAPLGITYPSAIFNDVIEIRRLVAALTHYPRSMHAVQHGNPYAHLQVADAYDGSSFDVWAVSPDTITIVPRLKATEAAVDRLIHYIFESFREGTVGNYGEQH